MLSISYEVHYAHRQRPNELCKAFSTERALRQVFSFPQCRTCTEILEDVDAKIRTSSNIPWHHAKSVRGQYFVAICYAQFYASIIVHRSRSPDPIDNVSRSSLWPLARDKTHEKALLQNNSPELLLQLRHGKIIIAKIFPHLPIIKERGCGMHGHVIVSYIDLNVKGHHYQSQMCLPVHTFTLC